MADFEMTGAGICLGREGTETGIRVYKDVSDWLETYAGGSGLMLFTSPNGKVWPIETELDTENGRLYGKIGITETAKFGNGCVEARWMYAGGMAASEKENVYILPAAFRGEIPKGTPSWVQELILGFEYAAQVADKAAASADEARASEEAAAASAQEAGAQAQLSAGSAEAAAGSATQAAGSAQAAAQSAAAAATAADQVTAATAAETLEYLGM